MTRLIKSAVILILISLSVPLKLTAQVEEMAPGMAAILPVPGYILLNNGDTLFGEIRWALKYVENNPVEVKFIAENGESRFFNASEIKGFGNRLKTWEENNPIPFYFIPEDYVSLPSFKRGVPVFMNRLISGRLTVYQNRKSVILSSTKTESHTHIDGIGFRFTPGEGLFIGPTYRTDYRIIESRTRFASYFVSKEGGAIVKVEKENYDDLYGTLFGDCPAIRQETDKTPDLKKFKNFMILAEVYNQLCR